MMADAESGAQDAENEERLGRGLILDVVLHRVWQEEGGLEVNLGQDESEQDGRVGWLPDSVQVRRHT